MANSVPRVSTVALGLAVFVLSPPATVHADTSAQIALTPSSPTPSLTEPAPTLDFWAESGPDETAVGQRPAARYHHRRHAARDGHRYAHYTHNPVAVAAASVVADLGSLAAYPFYCFPNYGSCSVRWRYPF
jgi:hypothetical protein